MYGNKSCVCTSVVLALGEGYQQVVGGGAVRLVTYPQSRGTLSGLGAMPGTSASHTLVGQGYLGSPATRAMPYPQPQVQMASGTRKYLRSCCADEIASTKLKYQNKADKE